jgi:phage tail P2-like protein
MANLLPPNSTTLERNLATVGAIIGDLPTPLRDLVNPDTCPAALLPWLASELSVDTWDNAWTEAQKRAVIKASIRVHRMKGTVASVREILQVTGADVELVEWWQEEPRGTPHTFRLDVEIEDRGINEATLESIERQVASVKPVRSHFTTRMIGRTTAAQRYGIITVSGETTEVLPYSLTQIDAIPAMQFHAVAYQDWMTTTIYPQGAP